MYYVCMVKYGTSQRQTIYYFSGIIEIDNDQLLIRSDIIFDLCSNLFSPINTRLESLINLSPKNIVNYLNSHFSNQIYIIMSDEELQGKNLQPVTNYDKNQPIKGIIDLKNGIFTAF